jgi:hypothetical protein
MARKPEKSAFGRVLAALLYVVPLIPPFVVWFALHGRFESYQPTAVDILAIASAFIGLAVFMVAQNSRISAIYQSCRRINHDMKKIFDRLDRIEEWQRTDSLESKIQDSHPASPPEPRKKVIGVFGENSSFRPPTAETPEIRQEVQTSAPVPAMSDNDVAETVNRRFMESIRHSESSADQLAVTLSKHFEEPGEANIGVHVVFRDASVEESEIYRLDHDGMSMPTRSILLILQGGQKLMYPAPMTGQDSFQDVKAFQSNTPRPSQTRSSLNRCVPASLSEDGRNSFRLHNRGILEFRH